jgi:hypothetical protein
MTEPDVKREILERLDRLPPEAQAQVLDYVRGMSEGQSLPPGEPGVNLLKYAGWIDPASLKEMQAAIEEEFEQVDPREW